MIYQYIKWWSEILYWDSLFHSWSWCGNIGNDACTSSILIYLAFYFSTTYFSQIIYRFIFQYISISSLFHPSCFLYTAFLISFCFLCPEQTTRRVTKQNMDHQLVKIPEVDRGLQHAHVCRMYLLMVWKIIVETKELR